MLTPEKSKQTVERVQGYVYLGHQIKLGIENQDFEIQGRVV